MNRFLFFFSFIRSYFFLFCQRDGIHGVLECLNVGLLITATRRRCSPSPTLWSSRGWPIWDTASSIWTIAGVPRRAQLRESCRAIPSAFPRGWRRWRTTSTPGASSSGSTPAWAPKPVAEGGQAALVITNKMPERWLDGVLILSKLTSMFQTLSFFLSFSFVLLAFLFENSHFFGIGLCDCFYFFFFECLEVVHALVDIQFKSCTRTSQRP